MAFVIIFFLVVVVFFIFGMRYITRERKISWSGEVVDKEQSEWTDNNDKINLSYILKVKLDDGKMHEVEVGKEFYDEVKIGDKIKKDKGTARPIKI